MSSIEKYSNFYITFLFIYPFLFFPFGTVYSTTANKLVLITTFVSIGWIFWIKKFINSQSSLKLFKSSGEKLVVLFFGLACLSTIFSVDLFSSFIGSAKEYNGLLAWYGFLSIFLFTYHFIKAEQKYVTVITAIVCSGTIVSVYSILQQLNIHEHMPYQKSWGLFDNPNHLGTYLVLMVSLTFTLLLIAKKNITIYLYFGILSVMFLALFYSGSRGAWLSVAICMVMYTIFIVWPKKYLWKRWGIILISIFIVFSIVDVIENGIISNRLGSITNDIYSIITEDPTNQEADAAGSGRWGIWQKTLPLVTENILTGTGPSTFAQMYYGEEPVGGLDNSHNDYLEIAFSMGIPALIIYISLIFTVVKDGFLTARKSNDKEQIYIYGLLITIIGYLIKTNFNISTIAVAPYFWIVLGVVYGYVKSRSPQR